VRAREPAGVGFNGPMETSVIVADDPPAARYEIAVDGEVVGFTQYRTRPGLIAFIHTEVDERMEGRGLGGRLIGAALDDARAKGLAVLPFCPFVDAYMKRHREYVELVPADQREGFGL
jgi:predicted GNAT family acetyltransferase